MANLFCALIGKGPLFIACAEILLKRNIGIAGVVSDCNQVSDWCQQQGIALIGTAEDQSKFLSRQPIDFLFSIVNHKIIEPAILSIPDKAAINYHDSPLPAYAGFNATAWAILDAREQHGVTWHRMSETVDSGDILESETFAILDEDTAFTLSAKCGEAAVRGFGRLLDKIEADNLTGTPQSEAESFHMRSDRPGSGILDWNQSAQQIQRFVRGLDFGPDESWMTTAKLKAPDGSYIRAGTATAIDGGSNAEPGTVSSVHQGNLGVAVNDGVVALAELSTLEGDQLDAAALAAMGVVKGALLRSPDQIELKTLEDLDKRITRSERFWLHRLVDFAPTQLSELTLHDNTPSVAEVALPLPPGVAAMPDLKRRATILAALVTYLQSVGEDVSPVTLGFRQHALSPEANGLYSGSTPLSLAVHGDTSWNECVDAAAKELGLQEKHETFAVDISLRYPELRTANHFATRKPVLASIGIPATLPAGSHLCLDIDAGDKLTVIHDTASIQTEAAELLLHRIEHILTQSIDDSSLTIGSFITLAEKERELLLETWQQTSGDYAADVCIHSLFEQQVERTPEKTALVCRSEEISYDTLNRRANGLAVRLQELGVGPDQLVGVCIERSIEMLVALLAVMKAGGAYVPMDPAYPLERLSVMLEDSDAKVLISQQHLQSRLPAHDATVVFVEEATVEIESAPSTTVTSANLAYVIFTSGSTGRPKGVMVEHRNVSNFFSGMDEILGTEPGVWLAVTSISFDISVLELFWTLARGFKVVIQEEGDRASLQASQSVQPSSTPMDFGLFYFAADSTDAANRDAYKVLLDGARFADEHGFVSVWTPERHFHAFGGLYPNPAVTSAALAVATNNLEIRAGSVVLPLHNPIRVAEDWAVVDNLSGGRVGLSFASGWHANDFALMPQNYERRRELMSESIETVLKLWRGEKITVANGEGKDIEVGVLPRPIRERPPMWVASAGNVETFKIAGRAGHNILTNMLGQDLKDLEAKFAAYRQARKECGHEGEGIVSVMLHTFVCDDDDKAREIAREPFCNYMASSYDLVKVAPWMFPAFKQPSQGGDAASAFNPESFDDEDMKALLDHAFERYFETAGLFGTPETALAVVEQLKAIGATEVACLVDFGIEPDVVLENLVHLDRLRQLANSVESPVSGAMPVALSEQLTNHNVTHFQCTPSMARMLLADGSVDAMGSLGTLLLGGEALPLDLVQKLSPNLGGNIINMYGPTETTIWSTTSAVDVNQKISIGKPIVNTVTRVLDGQGRLCPIGTAGELCIGGEGVVRGYLSRPELTADRFIADPYQAKNRLYRTGDLVRYRSTGELEYLGRIDQQVKLNGYRIELGEIESVMARHPLVHEAVVAVKGDNSFSQLVGYFVPSGGKSSSHESSEHDVTTWGDRWNEAYERRVGAESSSTRFDFSGWLDSFTGSPLSESDMQEWLDHTLARLQLINPSRILELGCGTGMVLFGCLDSAEHYTGADLSSHALESIRQELTADERLKITLLNQAAHELQNIDDGSIDTVVINSVAQYFPSADYLDHVLDSAARVVSDQGSIFIGDVRSLDHQSLFHTLVEVNQAPGQTGREALNERISERVDNESELLLSPQYFGNWLDRNPDWKLQTLSIKSSRCVNEMTLFRYDVVLKKDASITPVFNDHSVPTLDCPGELSAVASGLEGNTSALLVTGMKNARLSRVGEIETRLQGAEAYYADSLREFLTEPVDGIDPAELAGLSADFSVEMRWGSDVSTFDALFRYRDLDAPGYWPLSDASAGSVSNNPASQIDSSTLLPKLRQHLKDFLPDYMIPGAFVSMDTFPLTPNGKIDRNALPEPGADKKRVAAPEYAVPTNDLEKSIAQIWQQLLGLEKVGRRDNIFDLGASSLLTVEANNMLQTQLGRKIPLVNMFRFPTIEKLASHLGGPAPLTAGGNVEPDGSANNDKRDRVKAAAERRRLARARQKK